MAQKTRIAITAVLSVTLLVTGIVRSTPASAADVVVSVRNARAVEGRAVPFVVSLSRAPSKPTFVRFATIEGTADDSSDFVGRAGLMRFRAGQLRRHVNVAVNTDVQDEPLETMSFVLSSPYRARLGRSVAIGTIDDLNEPPVVSIADAEASEGDDLGFAVSLSAPSGHQVTVDLATDTHVAAVTFEPGEVSRTASVPTVDDDVVEPDRTIIASLSAPTHATLGDAQAIGTVLEDDDDDPAISIGDGSVSEGSSGGTTSLRLPVTLSQPSDDVVTVDYATTEQTATGADDFAPSEGTLRFLPGDVQATVTIPVTADDLDEEDEETLAVDLNSPTQATIEDGTAVGTITDDDAMPSLWIGDAGRYEPGRGEADLLFTVTLSAPSGRQVTTAFATQDHSARSPADYIAAAGTLTFEPGMTTTQIVVRVLGDNRDETREQFFVRLSEAVNASVARDEAIGNIRDTD